VARIFRCVLLGLFTAIVSAGSALAAPIPITDVFDPTPDTLFGPQQSSGACTGTNDPGTATDSVSGQVNGSCYTLDYTQDISAQFTIPPGLSSASLDLYFYDNTDPGNGNPESVTVTVDLGQTLVTDQTITTNSTSSNPDQFTFNVLTYVADGILNVKLTQGSAGQGQADFYFAKSVLNATWDPGDDETPLPEPVSLLLFGGGIGAVITRQARRRRSS